MTTLSLFMTVIVTKLHFKDIDDPVSPWLVQFLPKNFLTIADSRSNSSASDDNFKEQGLFGRPTSENIQLKASERFKVDWQKLSKLIDKVCLYIFSTGYVILALSSILASAFNSVEGDDGKCQPWRDAL